MPGFNPDDIDDEKGHPDDRPIKRHGRHSFPPYEEDDKSAEPGEPPDEFGGAEESLIEEENIEDLEQEEIEVLRKEIFLMSYNLLKTVQILNKDVESLYHIIMGVVNTLDDKGIVSLGDIKKVASQKKKSMEEKQFSALMGENPESENRTGQGGSSSPQANDSNKETSAVPVWLWVAVGGVVFLLLVLILVLILR